MTSAAPGRALDPKSRDRVNGGRAGGRGPGRWRWGPPSGGSAGEALGGKLKTEKVVFKVNGWESGGGTGAAGRARKFDIFERKSLGGGSFPVKSGYAAKDQSGHLPSQGLRSGGRGGALTPAGRSRRQHPGLGQAASRSLALCIPTAVSLPVAFPCHGGCG